MLPAASARSSFLLISASTMELASEASTYGRRPCSCWHHSAARETPPRRSRARMSEHWKEPTDPKRTRLEGNWVRLILRVTSSSTAASTELDLVVALVIRRVGRQRRVGAVRALALAILRGAGWVRRGQEAVDRHIRVLDGHAALQRERERPDRSTSADTSDCRFVCASGLHEGGSTAQRVVSRPRDRRCVQRSRGVLRHLVKSPCGWM